MDLQSIRLNDIIMSCDFSIIMDQFKNFESELRPPRISWQFLFKNFKYIYVFVDKSNKVIGFTVIKNKKISYFELSEGYRDKGIARYFLINILKNKWNGVTDVLPHSVDFWKKMKKERLLP
jgi:hypothetical protein